MLLSGGWAAARRLSRGATGRRFGVADPFFARTISSRSRFLKTTREPLQQPSPAAKEGFATGWRHAIALVATATTIAGFAAGVSYCTKGKGVAASALQEHPEVESNTPSAPDLSEVLSLLREAVGDDNVSVDDAERESHGQPHFSYHETARNPDVIVTPASTDEVVAVVKACAKHNIPMIPYGGATSLEGHTLAPMGGCSIDFSRMNRVLRLNRADHDVTIQPGLGYIDLNEMLKPHGVWFPLDPGPGASLGGMCACSCSGSTAVRYGTMNDNVVSLTAVLANGEVVKTSSRAKKSSAGYDLTRLFVGSEGTLGIITELTVKVHKIPTHATAVRVAFKSIDDAAKAVQDILAAGIQVGRAEMLDDTMMAVLNKVNNTKHEEATTLLFELAGESADSVKHAQATVLGLAKVRGGGPPHVATEPAECKELWRERKEALWSLMGLYPDLECMITDVCVPVSRLAELISSSKKELDASPLPAPIVAHAGDGNIHAFIMFDKNDPSATAEASRLSSFMVHKALDMEGTCTGEHGVGVGKIKYLPDEHGPGAMHAMRVIKRGLDPKGLMNPGKILEHRRDPATGRLVLCS